MNILTVYVGQGALAVARHNRDAVIIDSRIPSSGDPPQEEVEGILTAALEGHFVSGLILTGFDSDHADASGVDFILGTFEPDWVMYPKYYKDTDEATAVFEIIEKHVKLREDSERPLRRVSVRLDRLDSRILEGLSGKFEFELFSPHVEDMDNSNSCSIVLKLSGFGLGGFSYLTTGDTENERWERISELFGEALKSDVLAAPHHGSSNGCHPKSVSFIDPNTVLISAGVDNPYGHPDSQAVNVYSAIAEHVYATNVEGGVSLYTKRQGDDFETTLVRPKSRHSA